MNNKIIFVTLLILIGLALTGCDEMLVNTPVRPSPQQATQTADILIQANMARMTQEAAKPYIDATNTTEALKVAEATRVAGEQAQALALQITREAADLVNTQQAYDFQKTQIADQEIAQEKTRLAIAYIAQTQIAEPPTQTAIAATQKAFDNKQQADDMAAAVKKVSTPIATVFWTLLPLVIIGLLVVGFVIAYRKFMPVMEARSRYIRRPDGSLVYMSGDPNQLTLTTAPTAPAFGPSVTISPDGAIVGGYSSPEFQALINYQTFLVNLVKSFPQTKAGRDDVEAMLRRIQSEMTGKTDQGDQVVRVSGNDYPMIGVSDQLPPVAPWEILAGYHGQGLPVGLLESGQLLDPGIDDIPHRLFAGATGAGKSRRGARPAIALALAQGYIVFAIGDMPAPDFRVFDGHPNYHSLVVDQTEQILPYLDAAQAEVKNRWNQLYQNNASTWGRLPGSPPRVLLVVDEYAAIIDNLENPHQKNLQNRVANLSRLARKAGIHLLLGVQNPTRDSVRPSIRRNMLTVFFRTTDQAASLAVMGHAGAERLRDCQFMARVPGGEMALGVAFDPNDNQIVDMIESNQVQPHQLPAWLSNPPELTAVDDSDEDDLNVVQPQKPRRDDRIVQLYLEGKSHAEIEEAVFNYSGGRAYRIVTQVINNYLANNPVQEPGV